MTRRDDTEPRASEQPDRGPAPATASGDDAPAPGGSAAEGPDLSEVPFAALVREQLRRLDPRPDREGLERTPERVSDALAWLTRGHAMSLDGLFDEAAVEEDHDSMVVVKNVELYSLCEHHMLPFYGRAHLAYLPDGRIVRSSELPRVVEVFARRLQMQERLTEQIAGALEEGLEPEGVGVVVEAYHLCMMMRGVEKQNSKTVTSAVRGIFRSDPRTREEFLRLVHAAHEPR